jgi:hypothetical protein
VAKSDDSAKIREFFQKVGSNPLLRDRALAFSPRCPWTLLAHIPKNAKENAGGAAGGVWGGMPPRPQSVVCDDAISLTEHDFTFLRQFLLEVRTFFAENPCP